MRAALKIVGENDVPSEQVATKLVEIAQGFNASIKLLQHEDNPHVTALKKDADKAAAKGELEAADALLAEVEKEQEHHFDRLGLNIAETAGQRGVIALTRLRYLEAARHFAHAAGALPPGGGNDDVRVRFSIEQAKALYLQGYELGDNSSLQASVNLLKILVEEGPGKAPSRWLSICHYNLGATLLVLGEREINIGKLEDATVAYRSALQHLSDYFDPQLRVLIQYELGHALLFLGEREVGVTRMKEGIVIFRAILKGEVPERVRSSTRKSLGSALYMLGMRESGNAPLKEAVTTLKTALGECNRATEPLDWAMAQNSLGVALWALGRRQGRTTTLRKAVGALRAALNERPRKRVPLQWATTQNNLGNALQSLGALELDKFKIEQAIDAYHAALEERTRKRVPLRWAETQNNLGYALFKFSEQEDGPSRLREALQAFKAALEERTFKFLPSQWVETQENLAAVRKLLLERQRMVLTK